MLDSMSASSAHGKGATRLQISGILSTPNLSEICRVKVTSHAETLADHKIRASAMGAIRSLISTVTVFEDESGKSVELEGAIAAMTYLAQPSAEGVLIRVESKWSRGLDLA